VSSKEGEGSTFGFFFKVRRAVGNNEDGRPPLQSRSTSESSNASARVDNSGSRPPRPGYSRTNSNLQSIKEQKNERPEPKTLSSHSGVDTDDVEPSLKNPPTEHRPESHPESCEDNRYKETERATKDVSANKPDMERKLPDLRRGETTRQEDAAAEISRSQSDQRSDEKQTLLLVEDNLINQKVLRRQLQSRGFEVFTANNGQEAIDAVAERGQANNGPNDRNYFDCILMDQEMPIKDGNAATQEIRVLQEEGKAGYSHILGVSANVRDAQTNSMREAGMGEQLPCSTAWRHVLTSPDDVISKPFKVDDLVKKVRSLILDNGGSTKHDNRPNGNPESQHEDKTGRKMSRNTLHPNDGSSPSDGRSRKEVEAGNERESNARGGERSRSRASIKKGLPTDRQQS
jgi:CheY-like chemotaxis protein